MDPEHFSEHHNRASSLVRNGIRKRYIYGKRARPGYAKAGHLRILVEGPLDVFFKNTEKTLELCRQADVGEVWFLTSSEVP